MATLPTKALRDRTKRSDRRADVRQKLADIKSEKGCEMCGYNEHPAALDFDHINPEEKSFIISHAVSRDRPWSLIEAEVSKCRILCANCHRIHTYDNNIARLGKDGTRSCKTSTTTGGTWMVL
jgi:hypothetical protein